MECVESGFYGYAISEDDIITSENFIDSVELPGVGAYLAIQDNGSFIRIIQDFNGSYGLYYYEDKDYFAVSNSFMMLVEHLSKNHELTLNQQYCQSFLFVELYSFIYEETLVNEIRTIPRDCEILISREEKSIDFIDIDYHEQSVDLNSKEALDILDRWFFKWIGIIRMLKSKTNNLTIDLTGGFDTRVIAALWLNANLDTDKINIRSKLLDVVREDYEIASQIANKFNFQLNKDVISMNIHEFEDILTSINLSFYVKLGFHNEMYYEFYRSDEKYYTISGDGGELIRGYPNKKPEEYLKFIKPVCKDTFFDFYEVSKDSFYRSLEKISGKYGIDMDCREITAKLYIEAINRNHFGKSCVESYFANRIKVTPLIDPVLSRLKLKDDKCDDEHLLMAVIYSRYCPELLNFKLESGRKIDDATIAHANDINKISPFEMIQLDYVSGPELKTQRNYDNLPDYDTNDEPRQYLIDVFHSRKFELEFKKYFPRQCYDLISKSIKTRHFNNVAHVYSAIAILKVIKEVEYSQNRNRIADKWIESFLDTSYINESYLDEEVRLNRKIENLKRENERLLNSKSWKVTEPLRKIKRFL